MPLSHLPIATVSETIVPWWQIVVPAACGLIGAIVGGLVSPYVNLKISKHARKLEVYKLIFPQMLSYSMRLLNEAEKYSRCIKVFESKMKDMISAGATPDVIESEKAIVEEQMKNCAEALLTASWLLGYDISHKNRQYMEVCGAWWAHLGTEESSGYGKAALASLVALQGEVRQKLQIDVVDGLFEDDIKQLRKRRRN